MSRTTYDVNSNMKTAKFALAQFTYDEFLNFWPGIEQMLDAVPHTWKHWTKDYIVSAVQDNAMQVWGIGPPPDAVLIFFTQIGVYPADKVLHIVWGAGNFEAAMLPTLEAALVNFAQEAGCTSIEIRGRPGWDPHFKSIGMKREYVTWSLPVNRVRTH